MASSLSFLNSLYHVVLRVQKRLVRPAEVVELLLPVARDPGT